MQSLTSRTVVAEALLGRLGSSLVVASDLVPGTQRELLGTRPGAAAAAGMLLWGWAACLSEGLGMAGEMSWCQGRAFLHHEDLQVFQSNQSLSPLPSIA